MIYCVLVAWPCTVEVSTLHTLSRVFDSHNTAVFGPAATTWFKFLQNKIILKNKNLEILARVAADQVVFASTNLFVFLNSMALMEGSDPKEKIAKSYWPALTANWTIWPFVQFVNFKFVPLNQRVLVVNVISIGWNCYLSALNSK